MIHHLDCPLYDKFYCGWLLKSTPFNGVDFNRHNMNRFYVPYVVGRCVAKNVHEENHMQIWNVNSLGILVM